LPISEATLARKQTGSYYTPRLLAKFLVTWAIREKTDKILDCGVGNGIFLEESLQRLRRLGVRDTEASQQLKGVELDREAASRAKSALEELGLSRDVVSNQNFFELSAVQSFDAVVGNPPYIRYHLFKNDEREKALKAASSSGVTLTSLMSSWAPFVAHAVSFLNETGRLAMVLPAELLAVDYAAPIRSLVMERLPSITIIAFEKRVFPDVLEDTVLVLAEKRPKRRGLSVIRLRDERELQAIDPTRLARNLAPRFVLAPEQFAKKWTDYLLGLNELEAYRRITERDDIVTLGALGHVDIGVVTGNNKFFILSDLEAKRWAIESRLLAPIITNARHLTGLALRSDDFEKLRKQNEKCHLLRIEPKEDIADLKVRKYLDYGEVKKVDKGYKTSNRDPWYCVPYSEKYADAFVTYMAHEAPRITLNEARVLNTNTIHSFFMNNSQTSHALVAGFYNTFTLLSAELSGRSYGGGVFKLETQEAENVKLPQLSAKAGTIKELNNTLLRKNRLSETIEVVDEIVLENHLELTRSQIRRLEVAYESIKKRRLSRSA